MLERAGVLSWVNRIKRVREAVPGLFGKASEWRWRVVRTSNGYAFSDPLASKSEKPTRTAAQVKAEDTFASDVPRSGLRGAPTGDSATVAPLSRAVLTDKSPGAFEPPGLK